MTFYMKIDERDREREKAALLKDDMDPNAAKRRKLKREHVPSSEPGEYSPVAPPPPLTISMSQSYDGRERIERKGGMSQRPGYMDEPGPRMHGKDLANKLTRRDADPYPRIENF